MTVSCTYRFPLRFVHADLASAAKYLGDDFSHLYAFESQHGNKGDVRVIGRRHDNV